MSDEKQAKPRTGTERNPRKKGPKDNDPKKVLPRPGARSGGGKYSRTDIDWDIVEQWYVTGEVVEQRGKNGDLIRRHPSFADIARKWKTSTQLVGYHARKRKWTEKRTTFKRMQEKMIAAEVAKSRALSMSEAVAILDAWLLKFKDQLTKDRVRVDSVSDFNIAMRLKGFIERETTSAEGVTGGPSLDDLHHRHRAARKLAADLDDASAGVDDGGEPNGAPSMH